MNSISYKFLQFPEEIKTYLKVNENSNRDENQMYELLSTQDLDGVPWFHYTIIFSKAMSCTLANNRSLNLSERLFHLRDHNGNTAFQQRYLAFLFLQFATEEVFQICDANGKTFLHYETNFVQFCTRCKDLPLEYFIKMVSIKDSSGVPVAHYEAVVSKAVAHIKAHPEYSLEYLKQFCSILDAHGHTPLYAQANFAKTLSLLPNRSLGEFITTLFLEDAHGKSPLHYPHNFQEFIERQNFNDEDLISIFKKGATLLDIHENFMIFCSLRNKQGVLIIDSCFEKLFPILEKMPSAQLVRIFSINVVPSVLHTKFTAFIERFIPQPQKLCEVLSALWQQGILPLTHPHFVRPLVHMLKSSPIACLSFFSIKDGEGTPILFDTRVGLAFLPVIEKFSTEDVKKVLSITCANGNTLLHNYFVLKQAASLVNTHKIILDSLANADGVAPWMFLQVQLSSSWLTRRKMVIPLLESISVEEYKKRVGVLHHKVVCAWQHIHSLLEAGTLSSNMLYMNHKHYSPENVLEALQLILQRMEQKAAWTGTPRQDEAEKLHLFYCSQLSNFEMLIQELEKQNSPQKSAGCLVDIAKVVFEGRCATAFHTEIEQKRDLILEAGCDLDTTVHKAAAHSLQAMIDDWVRCYFANDVHARNQLYYAAHFTDQPDPLPPQNLLSVENAQNFIMHYFDPKWFYRLFGESISHEMAIDWLKLHTSATLGEKYRRLQHSLQEDEENLCIEMKKHLARVTASGMLEKLVAGLKTTPIPSCRASHHLLTKAELVKQAFDEIPLFASFLNNPIVIPVPNTFTTSDELKAQVSTAIKNFEKTFAKDASYIKKLQESRAAQEKLFDEIEAIFAIDKLMNECEIPLGDRKAILEIAQVYSQGIEMLGEQLADLRCVQLPQEILDVPQDISYSAKLHGLPSNACEEARRRAYNKHSMAKRGVALFNILLGVGVFEKVWGKQKQ
jgi:hypothetical protein